MTFTISPDGVTQRMAVVPDEAWPVPSHRASEQRPSMDAFNLATLSDWLAAAEIPVEGVDTVIRAG
jgi:ribonuclease Z